MTDYKQLITRMADELDHYRQLLMDNRSEVHALATEARTALAEPDGPAVSDDREPAVTMLDDLIEQLESDIDRYEISTSEALARAYAAGADQQLAEDAKWLDHHALNEAHLKTIPVGDLLKEAMRPKPPSLKEQALEALNEADQGLNESEWRPRSNTIRRALEFLPD